MTHIDLKLNKKTENQFQTLVRTRQGEGTYIATHRNHNRAASLHVGHIQALMTLQTRGKNEEVKEKNGRERDGIMES